MPKKNSAPSAKVARSEIAPSPTSADVESGAVAPVAAPQPDQPGFFRRLSPLGKVISGIVAAISFATGIIAVIPLFTADTTNFGSLRISAAPFGEQHEFAVPADAPFATFPVGQAGTCSPDQQTWLEAHGTAISTRYLVDLRNVASSGAMLALKSFRGAGSATAGTPLIKVICDPSGGSASTVQAARLLVSDPSEVAYFDKSAFSQTAEGIPNSPVVWNLAPGETGQLVLDLYPSKSFTGTLKTTAFSGTDRRDVSIAVNGKKSITLPSLAFGGMTYLEVDGSLVCLTTQAGAQVSCPLTDLIGGSGN